MLCVYIHIPTHIATQTKINRRSQAPYLLLRIQRDHLRGGALPLLLPQLGLQRLEGLAALGALDPRALELRCRGLLVCWCRCEREGMHTDDGVHTFYYFSFFHFFYYYFY